MLVISISFANTLLLMTKPTENSGGGLRESIVNVIPKQPMEQPNDIVNAIPV